MREFFKPWRRKIGVVTLGLACVFAAAWIRSTFEGDYLRREQGLFSHVFISANGELKYMSWESPGTFRIDETSLGMDPGFLTKNFNAWVAEMRTSNTPFHEFRLQYSSIAVSLTLLSAWLLLSKPRQPKPQVTQTEPGPTTGT